MSCSALVPRPATANSDEGFKMHTRRWFLLALGTAGSGALAGKFLAGARGLREFKRKAHALGSSVSMQVFAKSSQDAEQALDAAFGEIELVGQVMSIYRTDSQISRLNRNGVVKQAHPYLKEVLEMSLALSHTSSGAFDVTVQPLWEAFSSAKLGGKVPSADEIKVTIEKVNWRKLLIAGDSVSLEEKGMAVTLNGIAQGYAADRALAALRKHGIRHALVDTGELGAEGRKPSNDPWKVGIQHPRKKEAFVDLAHLDGRCLSTSGDYATRFTGDGAYNHIFDPATGVSPNVFASVSVLARSGMEADGLSTAVFVMGAERGFDLIRAWKGAEAMAVLKDGSVLATDGFPGSKPS